MATLRTRTGRSGRCALGVRGGRHRVPRHQRAAVRRRVHDLVRRPRSVVGHRVRDGAGGVQARALARMGAREGLRRVHPDVGTGPRGVWRGARVPGPPADPGATGGGEYTVNTLTRLWWEGRPRRADRLSPGVSAHVGDGHFLAAYPLVGTVATPAAAVTGLAFGAFRIGCLRSFSESLTLVLVAVALGYLAGQLGAAFVAGFAVGDFLIGQTRWIFHSKGSGIMGDGLIAGVLRIRVPMLIAYLLLLALAVALPALFRRLLADLPGVRRLTGQFGFGVAVILNVVLVYLGVNVWVKAAAVLIRPLYTWSVRLTVFGFPIPPERVVAREAVQTFQDDGIWIVRVAVIATLVRFALVWLTLEVPALNRRLLAVEHELAHPVPDAPASQRYRRLPVAVLTAGLSTLMLSVLIEAWWMAARFVGAFFLIRALSSGLIPPRLDWWRRLVGRIPLLVRLAVAPLAVQAMATSFVGPTHSFTPMALFIAAAVGVLYLLVPRAPRRAEA